MLDFFRSRQWVIARRLVLIAILIVVGYRSYGDAIVSRLRGPSPQRDIVVTRSEFRGELPGIKPAWIIGFRNNSNRFTYDEIELQATYMDNMGQILDTDKLVVKQRLTPGDEKIIGSVDFKNRGAATQGTLRVMGAQVIKK
jgi:hypothetical protein